MPIPREAPYVWATWLTRLLVGAASCEWAAWYKAHYQRLDSEKVPSTMDWTQYRLAHTALLNKAREEYEAQGYAVTTESQNAFSVRGRSATLAGIPDLIAVKADEGVIIDAKSLKVQPWHAAQVQLYMWAVAKAFRGAARTFSGLLYYPDTRVAIPSTAVDEAFIRILTGLISRVSSQQEARRVPSARECQWCDITAAGCPERACGDDRLEGETDEF